MKKDISLIILSAGNSTRFQQSVAKQWIRVKNNIPLWKFVAKKIKNCYPFKNNIITFSESDINYAKNFLDNEQAVIGGDTRQNSIKNALEKVDTKYVLITDVARACVSKSLVKKLIKNIKDNDCVVPYIGVSDTVVYKNKKINRDKIKRVQTPQISKVSILKKALNQNLDFTDESTLVLSVGGRVKYIKGELEAEKITYKDDLKKITCLQKAKAEYRVGNGFDVHQLIKSKNRLMLCGVEIDSEYSFKAHSDGDVGIHSLIDALLGASGVGDIGELFPDSDNRFKDIDSTILLKEVVYKIKRYGFKIVNCDLTIIAQTPRLSNYKFNMRKKISEILNINLDKISIKATTTERLGFVGREEGVGVVSSVLLKEATI